MRTARPRTVTLSASALALLPMLVAGASKAVAFQVGRSPDFSNCNIWFNDQGQPLRNKLGREIGQAVPCPGQEVRRDSYKVYAGAAKNTLILRDESRHVECVLSLAPGSTTIMVPTLCRQMP